MRILVVDDDPAVRESLRRSLQFNGYSVELASDGQQAMGAVARQRPDAMVLDMTMPRLDGLEVCRRLRTTGDGLPVLLLTARDAVSDRVAGLDAGADDYLSKPFALEELLARLHALLRRATADHTRSTDTSPTLADTGPRAEVDVRADASTPPETDPGGSPTEPSAAGTAELTSRRFGTFRVDRIVWSNAEIISFAAVIVAVIALIPPFVGLLWQPDGAVATRASYDLLRISGLEVLPAGDFPRVAYQVRVHVQMASETPRGYTYWLVLVLRRGDGTMYLEDQQQVVADSSVAGFRLGLLPESVAKRCIFFVEADRAATAELREIAARQTAGDRSGYDQQLPAGVATVSVSCRFGMPG